jgi:hypothetical protein
MDDAGSDAGPSGEDAGSDAGTGEDAVRVRRFLRYSSPSGVEELPEDFAQNPVELFVVEGGARVLIPGSPVGPGEYVFPNVPRVPYFLRWGRDYVLTDARSVDLSDSYQLRSGAGELEGNSEVRLDVSNVEHWLGFPTPAPELHFFSEEVSTVTSRLATLTEEGDGRVQETLPEVYMPRFEQAHGDRAWVTQLSPRPLGDRPDGGIQHYLTAVRALHLPPFSHDGTAPLRIEGRLEPLEMSEVVVDWRATEFFSAAAEVHPSGGGTTSTFRLHRAAAPPAEVWNSRSELLRLSFRQATAYDVQGTLTYGNPARSQETVVGRASVSTLSTFELPDQSPVLTNRTTISVVDRLSRLAAGPIRPGVWPPRGLSVDGTEAYSPRTLAAGAPVVSWQPPSRGSPDAYVLSLIWFMGDAGRRFPFSAARIHMDGGTTSVQLPPGLLQPGHHYYFIVEAVGAEGDPVMDRPLALTDRIGVSRAQTHSGVFSIQAASP